MSNPMTGDWGGRARRAREARGLSQEEAAQRAGTSQTALSRIELGNQLPGSQLQIDLADLYGVSVTALFPRTDDEAALTEQIAELESTLARTGNGCS